MSRVLNLTPHRGRRASVVPGGQLGVTVIELMFVIVIMGILAAITVPSFRDASLSSRLTAAANSLHGSIQIARSEAIKANAPTTLCTSDDGATCAAGGDWEQGWIILNADGDVIHSEAELPNGFKVIEAGGTLQLNFQPIGVGGATASFTICRDDPVGRQERVLTMTGTGVAYVTTTENGECPPA